MRDEVVFADRRQPLEILPALNIGRVDARRRILLMVKRRMVIGYLKLALHLPKLVRLNGCLVERGKACHRTIAREKLIDQCKLLKVREGAHAILW